jgi:predicted GIY-YIG superfamily endonuclease
VGTTNSLERRLREHERGLAGRTTSLDPPAGVLYSEVHPTLVSARRREVQLKRWSRAKKEALIRADLQSLKALAQRHKR